ncbi:MAG: hypothetical protein JXP73_09360 [Deltaproteobacteria bacterium]|nr:hypothetical protein [Deltaproteobacteria bacterium]
MMRTSFGFSVLLVASFQAASALAAPKQLKPSGKVTAGEGMLHDAFAFDESGRRLATIRFTAKGAVQILIGPPGGKARATDISSFTATPEKILGLSGYWFVVSNEGRRRAAIVDGNGRIRRTTQSFDDCELSMSPKAFVAVSETNEPSGSRRFTIQAYKPNGSTLMLKDVVVESNGTIVGGGGATFLGFTNSHFAAMVEKPGAYDRKTDVRRPPQFALWNVKSGKAGPGRTPPKLANFLEYVHKRGEKPDQSAVIVLAEGQKGYELVGPGEKVRPLDLTVPVRDYDPTSLQQHQVGNKIVFSLLADRPGRKQGDMDEEARFALGFFSLDPGSGKVSVIGEIGLPDKQTYPWSAGGNKIAVSRKNADGNREILIYSR